ncbi:ABC transporter permease [Pseudarthrobacter sp. Y6]|uniref:ABC transporter permease n=1 Tax=Pseudarthrobacter sp. Y6 TaxID=3418422 RepID=UPI003CF2191B
MKSLSWRYLLGRVARLALTIWIALTLMFVIPRLGKSDPADAIMAKLAESGGSGNQALVNSLIERFGLNEPLWRQYLNYVWNTIRFDNGYSMSQFPTQTNSLVAQAAPWTFGLVIISTLVAFAIGTVIGAAMGWRKTPRWLARILPGSLVFSSLPAFMLGIILLFLFSQVWPLFPFSGAYDPLVPPGWNLPFVSSVIRHGALPVLSVVLVQMGSWAIGMRGAIVNTSGEDYMLLAEAKGVKPWTLFHRYAVRNAILPQFTALGLALGTAASGVVVVETVFAYPGLGSLLYRAILANDYSVIEGISYLLILGVAVSVFILDLIYPLLDPRINYGRK